MPESWERTVSQAREHIDISQIIADEHDRNFAMYKLGFFIDRDREYSERVSSWCRWEITVPQGWGGENFKKIPLGF